MISYKFCKGYFWIIRGNHTIIIIIIIKAIIIAERLEEKQAKYIELRARIKRGYKSIGVYQINIVFDFLGGHHEQLRCDLRSITSTDKELSYVIERCQKWVLSQNVNIVKKFHELVSTEKGM